MPIRFLLAGLALATAASAAEAGPFRRYAYSYSQPSYQPTYPSYYQSYYQPVYQFPADAAPAPTDTTPTAPAATAEVVQAGAFVVDGDGLDEVNAQRAARGLRPFVRDDGLTQAARACAQYRAAHLMFGHTSNDFAFVPAGAYARSAGCAAYPAGYGWMSCCVYENATYAGAAYVTGRDGKRYMHLFVR
jgi:hypothetical protein